MATQNSINTPFPINVASGGTGAQTFTANSLLLGNGTSALSALGAATNGQIAIGSTSAAPVLATITGGTGISVTNGAGTISIASSAGPGITWNNVTTTSASAAVNNGYIANDGSLVTITLPATAAIGSVVAVVGSGAGGWKIAQNSGQTVYFDGDTTTAGTGGSLASTVQYDCVELICNAANTGFVVRSSVGNITVV